MIIVLARSFTTVQDDSGANNIVSFENVVIFYKETILNRSETTYGLLVHSR